MIKTLEAPFRRAPVFYENETSSTNTQLKEMAAWAEHGTVLIAGRQTGGRGRLGRTFLSSEGGLYLSMLLKFAEFDERLTSITAVTAVAVAETLDKLGIQTMIKWPNDIKLDGKKLCGILTEAVCRGEETDVIVGIGINLNQAFFPPEITDIATSVFIGRGENIEENAFAMSLISELDSMFEHAPEFPEDCLQKYRQRCDTIGKQMDSGAVAVRVENDYSLVLRDKDGTEHIRFFGEIG